MVSSDDFAMDPFFLGVALPILMVFIPLFEAGDHFASSRSAVADQAAHGPWLEEALDERRLRIGAMHSARALGLLPRCHGFGRVDRSACLTALKSWFSILQMLLNLRS
ncbi:uncharacterized protein LOC127751630 [Frankliniella occidentalis]|uniref:Uncharacterized protein LOC127751630 n=1 Tax=Frankliniella occidentalis TaxID=133901 RepID=A0A9C6X972_FRAOC|nr:uncharacterized protein LOC127751630 [Frankliniella occidentalis]